MKKSQLELYHDGDRTSVLSEMAYSERAKNTALVYRPCFSFIGETQPETYYSTLSEDQIKQGLISRLLPIEYYGKRPPSNWYNENPPADMVRNVANLGAQCLMLMQKNQFIRVAFDPAANHAQDLYDKKVDAQINETKSNALVEIWNRAHVKALRLASLVAVGINSHNPIVTLDIWQWAERIVEHSTLNTVDKFERGEVGLPGNGGQHRAMADIMLDWMTGTWDDVKSVCQIKEGELYHKHRLIIPRSYISNRTQKSGAFLGDKDPRRAVYATLREFAEGGLIQIMKANQIKDRNTGEFMFTSHGEVYVITDETMFKARALGRRH